MGTQSTSTPHDALFKFTFSNVRNAASALRAVLPKPLVARLDWSTLTLESGTYVEDSLSERRSDCLYSIQLDGRQVWLYLLFEHQSTPDGFMAFRLLDYMLCIWRIWLANDDNRKSGRLPAILPVVLFHGEQGWNTSRRFSDLLDLDPALRAVLKPWLPDFEFLLDDLSAVGTDELQARQLTGMAYLTELSLKLGRGGESLTDWLVRDPDALRAAHAEGGMTAVIALINYAIIVGKVYPEPLADRIANVLGARSKEAIMSAVKSYYEEGIEQGYAKGREEGREVGREEGREEGREVGREEGREVGREEGRTLAARRMLSRLIELRFGPPDADLQAHIDELDLETAEQLVERLIAVASLTELLDEMQLKKTPPG